jgi:hypothetical protein
VITGYTGADGANKKESDEDRKKITFEDFMSEQRTMTQKFWDGHPSDVMPFEQVQTLMENILDTQEPAKFLEFKKQWQSCERAFHQIAKGAKQSADDTMRHMKVRLAASTREKKRKADQDAKAELQKVREDAKAAADLIKKRKQCNEDKVDPLYTVNISAEVAAEVCKMDPKDLSQTTWRLSWPWKIEASDSAQVCVSKAKLSKTLSFWGAQYKKTMAQSKLTQVTYPVEEKTGLAEVTAFFEDIIPIADKPDITGVPGGKAFMDSAWLFGCSNDMKQTGFLLNHAALHKMLVVGEVRHVLFEWKSLVVGVKKIKEQAGKSDDLSTDDVLAFLMNVDEANLTLLFKHGANIRQCSLAKLEVLFIPMGWLCVEISFSNSFIYGIRKSVFVKGLASEYEGAIQRVEAAGKSVDKMKSILDILKQG